jgi:hypothetical protein
MKIETALASTKQSLPFTTVQALNSGLWNPIIVTIPRAEAKDVRVIRLDTFVFRTAGGK